MRHAQEIYSTVLRVNIANDPYRRVRLIVNFHNGGEPIPRAEGASHSAAKFVMPQPPCTSSRHTLIGNKHGC